MKIVSFRLSDDEHASLVQRAGSGRGALSDYIRQQLREPVATASFAAPKTTTAAAFVEWMTGHVGPNLRLRTL